MKSRKLVGAQELVEKAQGDKKVQKLIGKKPPPGKRGRPPTAKSKAKAKAKAKTQEDEQPEDPSDHEPEDQEADDMQEEDED